MLHLKKSYQKVKNILSSLNTTKAGSVKDSYKPEYPSLLQELEPRFMFDGAAFETVDLADGVSEQEQIYILNAIDQNEQAHATESLLQAIEANVEGFQTDYSKFKEVVIVDARVKDPHILIDSISRKAAIEVILPDQDGVDKIAELLAKYNNLDAVHIISHGDQAKLELGSIDLTSNNLAQYQMQLQQWGQALTEQGDILFYGCNVAEGEKGQAFIDQLRALTSADIAASIDITGSINRGGDFILEANEAVDVDAIIFDNLTYEHLLGDADGTLNALNVNSQPLIDLLINPHDILVQDPSGTNIYDGGEDMYDTGNILNTNLQSSISYTNGVVTNGDSSFGAGSKYFTKEYAPGYFIAVATGINITQFSITGGTGADLSGTITGGEFVAANSNYKVYYTLTGDTADPSINHLVIIKNNGGSSHSFSSSTDPENHIIQVGTSDELYFIVAAQKNGLTLTTTQLQDIANTFLDNYVGDAPVLTGGGNVLNYTENAPATVIDNTFIVNDVDDTHIESATISVSGNYANGQDVLAFVNTANISGNFNASTGVLTLTGSDTLANYQAALRTITYQNTSDNPNTLARTVSFVVYDGYANSNAVNSTINVAAVNDASVVVAGSTLNYTENDSATVIDAAITVNDADDTNIESATITISNNYVNGEDILSAAPAVFFIFDSLNRCFLKKIKYPAIFNSILNFYVASKNSRVYQKHIVHGMSC